MSNADDDNVYQLLDTDTDFDGQGFEIELERVPFDPGRGRISRLVFTDPDFDPKDETTEITLRVVADGDEDKAISKSVSFTGSGTYRRAKIYVNVLARYFGITWRLSSGGGSLSFVVDESGNNIVDESANKIVGPGSGFRVFKILGQTFGLQRTRSIRK